MSATETRQVSIVNTHKVYNNDSCNVVMDVMFPEKSRFYCMALFHSKTRHHVINIPLTSVGIT